MTDRTELIPLGIDHLTLSGMPPTEFIDLAAEANLQSVSLWSELRDNPFGAAHWSLINDAALRRSVRERIAATGIDLALGEAWALQPDTDASGCIPMVEAFADLGCGAINMVSSEKDRSRELEQAHEFAEIVTGAGMTVAWEYGSQCQADVLGVLDDIRQMRRAGLSVQLLIDPMHFTRRGHRAEELAGVEPELIGYFQICDVPLVGTGKYMDEALHRRLPPGDGELPLHDIVRVMPEGMIYSMEIPQVARVHAGESRLELVIEAAEKCRRIIAAARHPQVETSDVPA